MSSIEKRTLRGTVLGFVSFFINATHSIILVPFFLTYWGNVKYGIFIGIYAFIQLMRTLDGGHQSYIGNQFNLYFHSNKRKAYETLSSSIGIAFLIGFVEFVVFLFIWKFGIGARALGLEITGDKGIFIGISCMLIMWWLVGSVGGILTKAIMAKGLFSEATIFAIFIRIIELIVIGLAILTQISLASLFVAMAIINFIFSIIVLHWIYKKMPEYFPWWKGWKLKVGISNLVKSIVLTINGFLEQFNLTGAVFMVSQYLSTGLIPVFTTLRTMTNTMSMVTNIIILPLIPEMIRLHSAGKKDKIVKIFQTNWFFSGALVNIGFLLLIPFAEHLYSIWTNERLQFDKGLFYLLMMSIILFNYGKSLASYLAGINDLKAISFITWIRSIIIFGSGLLFIRSHGLISLGMGILLSEVICSVFLPIYFIKRHIKYELNKEKSLFIYAIPALIMGCTIYIVYYFDNFKFQICLLSMLVIIFTYYRQWIMLHISVREKLISLAEQYGLKYLKA